MSFYHVDIEKRNRLIVFGFMALLVAIYFVGALGLSWGTKLMFPFLFSLPAEKGGRFFLTLPEMKIVFIVSFSLAVFHWIISTFEILARIKKVLGGRDLDPDDSYHRMLSNIVEEVSVACGGKNIKCVVVGISDLNAFSVADLSNQAVIGVTEGLLFRLNRAQIEAVVAHEAAHIVSGDTMIKSVAVSLFGVYAAIFKEIVRLKFYKNFYGAFLYLLSGFFYFLGLIVGMFISRACEYKADAIAVKLVRDPLSLAQSLHIITTYWRGAGFGYQGLESLFIVSPDYNRFDRKQGFFADLFSTHPPAENRIGVLLSMAHSDVMALETKQGRYVQTQPFIKQAESKNLGWLLFSSGIWRGPFSPEALLALDGVIPNSFVKREGSQEANILSRTELMKLFNSKHGLNSSGSCPRCNGFLSKTFYEGVPIERCGSCRGVFLSQDKVKNIIIRREISFSKEIEKLSQVVERIAQDSYSFKKFRPCDGLKCPKCNQRMVENFYSFAYPIKVDRCRDCNAIWFDKDELEILQYLIEKNT
ncbi:MAG: zinc metalloprotease HtpX [Candidatus Omnitrophica bacterium]|nr:zinc metalloprotease HtpX [Candidatus Omnitrophota bacterium]